jgi:hypothetical protein
MPSRHQMRASDADRERVADRLRRATAEGRLLAEELEERLATALRARTYGELDALVADLPREPAPRRELAGLPRPAVALALTIAVPALLAVTAILLFVVTGFLLAWLPWLLLGWLALGGGARARRHGIHRRSSGGLGGPGALGACHRRHPHARPW